MVSYRVMLNVPRELVLFVFRVAGRPPPSDRHAEGNRKLGCYRQAVFALAWFRDKGDIPRLGPGSG